MAVDLVLHYPCKPKEVLGDGDMFAGTDRILECLMARRSAAAVAHMAEQQGESPHGQKIVMQFRQTGKEVVDTPVTYEELIRRSLELAPHEGECAGCPGNMRDEPFGCCGRITYPIRRAGEEWLMNRLQPSSTVGGKLFLAAIRDFGYTGEPLEPFREAGLFESKQPIVKGLTHGWLSSADNVTSDQLFQAIFCVEDPLDPAHCLGILLWLGCLKLDGNLVETPEQASTLFNLGDDRPQRIKLNLGSPAEDDAIAPLQFLLAALFTAWFLDIPIWVSA